MGLQEKLETLPLRPGVYLFKDRAGVVVYVGKARVLRDRVRSYFQPSRLPDPRRDALATEIADLELVVTDTEMEALALENNFIKRHQPRYNVLLRDDKNHPWLKLTLSEEYPRLHIVRRVNEDKNAYGGPYIPRKPRPEDGVPDAPDLRHPLVQGDAQRAPPAALPAVPDPPLPGAVCRRDLLARALPRRPARTRGCSWRAGRTRCCGG